MAAVFITLLFTICSGLRAIVCSLAFTYKPTRLRLITAAEELS